MNALKTSDITEVLQYLLLNCFDTKNELSKKTGVPIKVINQLLKPTNNTEINYYVNCIMREYIVCNRYYNRAKGVGAG